MKNYRAHKGFTLVEVLIYIALFGILMSGAVVAAYQLLDSGSRQDLSFAAQQDGTFINRKLAWALGPANSVSVLDGNKLTIYRNDFTLVFDGSGERMMFKRGSADSVPLTPEGLVVANTLFESIPPANGLPPAVRASYTIGGKQFTYAMYLR
jgi:prepilin-type N-terminal cleavage/methylation domain-containing protein